MNASAQNPQRIATAHAIEIFPHAGAIHAVCHCGWRTRIDYSLDLQRRAERIRDHVLAHLQYAETLERRRRFEGEDRINGVHL